VCCVWYAACGIEFQAARFLSEPNYAASVSTYKGVFDAMHCRVFNLKSMAAVDPGSHDGFVDKVSLQNHTCTTYLIVLCGAMWTFNIAT
jgi:hypothetical protein